MIKKETRGGQRKGAGRKQIEKAKKRVTLTFSGLAKAGILTTKV